MKDQGSDHNVSRGFSAVFNAFVKFAGMMAVSYAALYVVFKLMKMG
jgi:hypothetical protein